MLTSSSEKRKMRLFEKDEKVCFGMMQDCAFKKKEKNQALDANRARRIPTSNILRPI